MKKLYAIFALAGLVAVNDTNAMLPQLGRLGRASRSFVQPAREALLRSGKPIITPGTFTPSRLPQGQTLGLGQRGLTTGTRQSILPRLSRQKLPTTRTIFTARPQIQPGYFQALRNPQWQQYFTNALNTLRQNPRLQALLAGLGLGGAGAYGLAQPVLAEENINWNATDYLKYKSQRDEVQKFLEKLIVLLHDNKHFPIGFHVGSLGYNLNEGSLTGLTPEQKQKLLIEILDVSGTYISSFRKKYSNDSNYINKQNKTLVRFLYDLRDVFGEAEIDRVLANDPTKTKDALRTANEELKQFLKERFQ